MTVGPVFAALADPTRQQILDWLSDEGDGTATRFAARLEMTRQGVSRHLAELEKAGMVASRRVGRETIYRIETRSIEEASTWLSDRSRRWDEALERLKSHVED